MRAAESISRILKATSAVKPNVSFQVSDLQEIEKRLHGSADIFDCEKLIFFIIFDNFRCYLRKYNGLSLIY